MNATDFILNFHFPVSLSSFIAKDENGTPKTDKQGNPLYLSGEDYMFKANELDQIVARNARRSDSLIEAEGQEVPVGEVSWLGEVKEEIFRGGMKTEVTRMKEFGVRDLGQEKSTFIGAYMVGQMQTSVYMAEMDGKLCAVSIYESPTKVVSAKKMELK